MFILRDTFNDVLISKHRTVLGAVKAQAKHIRAVRKHNGDNSYLTYSITSTDGNTDLYYEIAKAEDETR